MAVDGLLKVLSGFGGNGDIKDRPPNGRVNILARGRVCGNWKTGEQLLGQKQLEKHTSFEIVHHRLREGKRGRIYGCRTVVQAQNGADLATAPALALVGGLGALSDASDAVPVAFGEVVGVQRWVRAEVVERQRALRHPPQKH